ncbi:MAG: hypothetical protein ACJ76Y_02795, partial [Thermoanaerobaculia bacterium]
QPTTCRASISRSSKSSRWTTGWLSLLVSTAKPSRPDSLCRQNAASRLVREEGPTQQQSETPFFFVYLGGTCFSLYH